MSEAGLILALWKSAAAAGDEVCLATIVGVEGSAYRRPGARMLLTASGLRAGTISGGCLEAEVSRKAWWLTERGPSIQRYSSFFDDDGDMPYGLGCGGTVVVLLERGEAAQAALEALRRSVEERQGSVVVTDTEDSAPGTKLILNQAGEVLFERGCDRRMAELAGEVLENGQTRSEEGRVFEFLAPPPSIFVFGAGDDARPVASFAAALGWHVTVADGRSQLARPERFPEAARVIAIGDSVPLPEPGGAAIIMTHSYEQDRTLLTTLLPRELRYLGILGPRRRTERLVGETAPLLGYSIADCFSRIHSPVGLDLGGHSPATIALSITAEIQAVLGGREPRKLTQIQPAHA